MKIYKDYEYLIVKSESTGNYLAYVKLDSKHPWTDSLRKKRQFSAFGTIYQNRDYYSIDVECHGGLTFGEYFRKPFKHWSKGYWIGWDYAHAGDYMPLIINNNGSRVWKEKEVEKECKSVIDQAIKAEV